MIPIEARKFYIRYRDGRAETEHQYAAEKGFRELGVETSPFTSSDEVHTGTLTDLAADVGIAGFVGDARGALAALGKPAPPDLDYPHELTAYLGRSVTRTTVGQVRKGVATAFIKPVEHKLFTGFVYRNDGESRMRIVSYADDVELWTSEVVEFVTEFRAFLLHGELVDVRRYTGSWSVVPDRASVEAACHEWKSQPAACCLDFGVTAAGETRVVEANDAFACAHYGLAPRLYARMLAARWWELMST